MRLRIHPLTPVGASLLAKRVCQSSMILLIYRFREQARSHRGDLWCFQDLLGMPYLRRRWAIAVCEVCRRLASCRVEG